MTDAEWLRGIAGSGWNDREISPEVKAMLRRAADRLDAAEDLLAACEAVAKQAFTECEEEERENAWAPVLMTVYAAIIKTRGDGHET